ncbi:MULTISPECIES: hypothetical protein [Mesorhizobium]|uniref:Uncharacterized protein n=1 Tax=Mesorhizobium wenxiniae TaxID=2014805 RepID=A0A271KFD7_9HYPH|nr:MULTISPECIES: hypothetical protein [Mesorhizobium]MCF6118534.1 hypothetical protein [Mesorhizobium muleiense]PAP94521.1 hypothetical protein CIT31_16105 [Mesorhizobium wenxiniae]RWB98858.1 MAG: hypothetical protein EOQ56_19175 [Mesorhizobium sp.]RWN31758.1 MAG: hypothetical protein EOR95_18420 [Mesorhizobium sp.]RWN51913.1 MAG: hypothetical protein EOR98_23965 [Mesorhizobium sp.]
MAYEVTNGPKCILSGFGGSPSIWVYNDGDAHGTVDGTDYFTDAKELGMKVGDLVFVQLTSDYTTTLHSVSAVDADGNGTISAAVLA